MELSISLAMVLCRWNLQRSTLCCLYSIHCPSKVVIGQLAYLVWLLVRHYLTVRCLTYLAVRLGQASPISRSLLVLLWMVFASCFERASVPVRFPH